MPHRAIRNRVGSSVPSNPRKNTISLVAEKVIIKNHKMVSDNKIKVRSVKDLFSLEVFSAS